MSGAEGERSGWFGRLAMLPFLLSALIVLPFFAPFLLLGMWLSTFTKDMKPGWRRGVIDGLINPASLAGLTIFVAMCILYGFRVIG